jgi:hypothetical protein
VERKFQLMLCVNEFPLEVPAIISKLEKALVGALGKAGYTTASVKVQQENRPGRHRRRRELLNELEVAPKGPKGRVASMGAAAAPVPAPIQPAAPVVVRRLLVVVKAMFMPVTDVLTKAELEAATGPASGYQIALAAQLGASGPQSCSFDGIGGQQSGCGAHASKHQPTAMPATAVAHTCSSCGAFSGGLSQQWLHSSW